MNMKACSLMVIWMDWIYSSSLSISTLRREIILQRYLNFVKSDIRMNVSQKFPSAHSTLSQMTYLIKFVHHLPTHKSGLVLTRSYTKLW